VVPAFVNRQRLAVGIVMDVAPFDGLTFVRWVFVGSFESSSEEM